MAHRREDHQAADHQAADHPAADHMPSDDPLLTNAEFVQLRIRVIALENVVIALLLQADEACSSRVREMATYISPRAGFTHHPLTLQAAAQMESLAERSARYRSMADLSEEALEEL